MTGVWGAGIASTDAFDVCSPIPWYEFPPTLCSAAHHLADGDLQLTLSSGGKTRRNCAHISLHFSLSLIHTLVVVPKLGLTLPACSRCDSCLWLRERTDGPTDGRVKEGNGMTGSGKSSGAEEEARLLLLPVVLFSSLALVPQTKTGPEHLCLCESAYHLPSSPSSTHLWPPFASSSRKYVQDRMRVKACYESRARMCTYWDRHTHAGDPSKERECMLYSR